MKLLKFCLCSLAISAGLSQAQLAAAQFNYSTIVVSAGDSTHGLSIPSIANNGTVAFVDTSGNGGVLYTGNGGPLTAVVTSPTYFAAYGAGGNSSPVGAAPSLNDSGGVAFWARTPAAPDHSTNNTGVISGTQTALNTIVSGDAPVGSGGFANYTTSPQISDSGTVVFAAYHNGGSPGVGVFSATGGVLTPLVINSTFTGNHSVDPAISHGGTIAYEWPTFGPSNGLTGDNLFVDVNGVTTLAASTNALFFDSIAVNNAGKIVASSTHLLQTAVSGERTAAPHRVGPRAVARRDAITGRGRRGGGGPR